MTSYPISSVSMIPGGGIGILKLGATLYDIVNHFKKTETAFKFVKIVYSSASLFETPIVLYLKNLGLRLIFDPVTQRLILIEAIEFNLIQFCYITNKNKFIVNRNGSPPTFKDIYNRYFGPTLPGKVHSKAKKYILSYPGIAFLFTLPENIIEELQLEQSSTRSEENDLSTETKEKLILLLSKAGCKCDTVIIFNPKSINGIRGSCNMPWEKFYNELSRAIFASTQQGLWLEAKPYREAITEFKKRRIVSVRNEALNEYQLAFAKKKKNYISISVIDIDMIRGLIRFNFSYHYKNFKYFILELNKTKQQNVLYYLGEPDSTYLKIDSRFKIYSGHGNEVNIFAPGNSQNYNGNESTTSSASNEMGKNEMSTSTDFNEVFHNYFRFGFDILYSTNNQYGSTAKKIIIHNNVPNSLYFNKYNKVNWLMKGYGNNINDDDIELGYDSQHIGNPVEQHPVEDANSEQNIFFPTFEPNVGNYKHGLSDWRWSDGVSLNNLATSEMYFRDINDENFKTIDLKRNGDLTNKFDPSNFVLIDRNNLLTFDADDTDSIDLISEIDDGEEATDIGGLGHAGEDGTNAACGSVLPHQGYLEATDQDSDQKPRERRKSSFRENDNFKWGQSKLYGFRRCIWEVLSDNDVVSSITLF